MTFFRRLKAKAVAQIPSTDGAVITTMLVVILCAIVLPPVAWITHVVTCLLTGQWGFLIAGAILFPIGIIHGVMIWFGFGY